MSKSEVARTGMVDSIHYNFPSLDDSGRKYNEGQYTDYKKYQNGTVVATTKSGAILTFAPDSTAKFQETHAPLFDSVHYEIEGDGLSIDTSYVDLSKIMPSTEYKEGTSPSFVEFSIKGNNNNVTAPQQSVVEIEGNGNNIATGNNADTIFVNGSDNVLSTNSGRDHVEIKSGSDNKTYLGDGIDNFKAPRKDESNVAYSGLVGHDNVSGGKYVKNENNRREFSASDVWTGTKNVASAIGSGIVSIGKGIKSWFVYSKEDEAAAREIIREAVRKKVLEAEGETFPEHYFDSE